MLEYQDILTPAQLEAVRTAARLDPARHDPRFATHAVLRDGEIVGALSVCRLQVTNIWSHSVLNGAIHTARIIQHARGLTYKAAAGRPWVTMCAAGSPIYPFMERFAFQRLGETTLFEEVK
jgi:hypothetical protein